MRRGDRPDKLLRGAQGRSKEQTPLPGPEGVPYQAHFGEQCGDLLLRLPDHRQGRGMVRRDGFQGSTGTKLLSISGDCTRPGVYELPFGIQVCEMLEKAGAENPYAVQIGGPSGQLIGREDFCRTICYDDIATGGSVMIFSEERSP